jgi:hypothetical protein
MKEFLDFLYNHDYPSSIKITFDKDFGSEAKVKELVYKLKSSEIITREDTRNTHIIASIDKYELYKLIREFNYNLDDYDMSKKPVVNNMTVKGGIKNSVVVQDSDLRGSTFKSSKTVTNDPKENEKRQSTMQILIDIILKYWFIPISIGVIILLIEYKSGFFIKPNP